MLEKKKIPKIPLNIFFLSCRKSFLGTQKQVRISHGKQAIGAYYRSITV